MKTIEIVVSPKGETVVQSKGFAGASCREATKALEQAMGVVRSDAPTAEMHHAVQRQEPLHQR